MDLRHISTKFMVMDPMNKELSAKHFKDHMDYMRIISSVFVSFVSCIIVIIFLEIKGMFVLCT